SAGARPEPPLGDAHADIDSLPLHGGGAPRPVRGGRPRSRPPPPEIRVGPETRRTGGGRVDARRGNRPRATSDLGIGAVRLRPGGAGARRRAPRRRPRARRRAGSPPRPP